MRVGIIPQSTTTGGPRRRVGDAICAALEDPRHDQFRFAVAYMRTSGIGRLAQALGSLRARAGTVSGVVGIDGGVTSLEALEALAAISSTSTVFHTASDLICHPKLYLLSGRDHALVIIGSANLTRDGLYRNIEVAAEIEFDLGHSDDEAAFRPYALFVDSLLDSERPNILRLTKTTIKRLSGLGLVKGEAQTVEPEVSTKRHPAHTRRAVATLFPPLSLPLAPPLASSRPTPRTREGHPPSVTPRTSSVFIMKLSAFDSSHRTGVKGTAEVLIPHPAIPFFPKLSTSGRKYPDSLFDVLLNTPTGAQTKRYRLWYYETRATGKKIDEYRLRMDHTTIDLSTPGGGDLLVISRRPGAAERAYEVTVVRQDGPEYERFSRLCDRTSQGKRWGVS